MMIPKDKPWRSPKYLAWIRTHDCENCFLPSHVGPIHAHHINGQGIQKARGDKIDDCYTIPMCPRCHDEVHRNKDIVDQKLVALKLFAKALREGIVKC